MLKSESQDITFSMHHFMCIEPNNKKQQKQLEGNRIRLGIKNKEEDFVLKCLLSFDWRRQVILYEVEKVSFIGNMINFRVSVKAPHKTVDYCCSNPFKEEGWIINNDNIGDGEQIYTLIDMSDGMTIIGNYTSKESKSNNYEKIIWQGENGYGKQLLVDWLNNPELSQEYRFATQEEVVRVVLYQSSRWRNN
jgi:hypothetical protein